MSLDSLDKEAKYINVIKGGMSEKDMEKSLAESTEYHIPPGYDMKPNGSIWKQKKESGNWVDSFEVISHPFGITGYSLDIDKKTYKTDVIIKNQLGVQHFSVPRSTLATQNGIVSLTDKLVAVSDVNKKALVQLVAKAESYYMSELNIKQTACRLGYVNHNNGFIPYDKTVSLSCDESEDRLQNRVNALVTRGDEEKCLEIFRDLYNFSTVNKIVISTFIAGLLIAPLQLNTFMCHLYGETSTGKSTLGKLLMSFWGDFEKLKITMSSTDNSLIKDLGFFKNMPVVADEITSRKEQNFDSLIFSITDEMEKGRLNNKLKQDQDQATWKLTVITNGNLPITSQNSDTAIYGRIIEIPCNEKLYPDKYTGGELHTLLLQNCGHLGRLFVKHILKQNLRELSDSRKLIETSLLRNALYKKLYYDKQLVNLASIIIASEIVNDVIKGTDPLLVEDALEFLQKKEESNVNIRAFKALCDICIANKHRFVPHQDEHYQGATWGFWDNEEIAINNTHVFRKELEALGYNPDNVRRWLSENDLLAQRGSSSLTVKRRAGGSIDRYTIIKNVIDSEEE